jgi:hypothetical protein
VGTTTNPRCKVINFRLSSTEYEKVCGACEAEGARTVSEFVRGSVLGRIQSEAPVQFDIAQWLLRLSEGMAKLEQEMATVLSWIGTNDGRGKVAKKIKSKA